MFEYFAFAISTKQPIVAVRETVLMMAASATSENIAAQQH